MKIYLFICTRHREFGIFNFLRYLRLPKALQGTLFWKKMIFFMKYFKLAHALTWKILHYMTGFLSICTRHKAFGFFDCFALSATLLCLVPSIFWKKMIFFMKYFKLVHAPTWKIPQYMNCFLFICTRHRVRYLQLFFAICDSRMLCKVHNFGKRYFFMKYFKLVHAPTWKIPHYMKGILFIYTRHRKFGIFNFYALSATPYCFARYFILEKDNFSWNIFKVGACPNLKDSFLYEIFSIHLYKT